jgi:hypothetical protein
VGDSKISDEDYLRLSILVYMKKKTMKKLSLPNMVLMAMKMGTLKKVIRLGANWSMLILLSQLTKSLYMLQEV